MRCEIDAEGLELDAGRDVPLLACIEHGCIEAMKPERILAP